MPDAGRTDAAPRKVAYIVHTFDTGGIERCVARLANRLDAERFRPLVICLNRSGSAAEWIEREDVRIIELHKKPRNDAGVILRLARALAESRVEVVHSHNWGTLVEAALARHWSRTPVHVHTEHGQGLHEDLPGPKRWLRARVRRWTFDSLDRLLICAESVRPLVQAQCGFPSERMQFMPNGVDAPEADGVASSAELRKTLGLRSGALVLGSVGRLVKVKDFALAIEAVAALAERGGDIHLVLVGDGPEQNALRLVAERLGIAPRVHFAGRQQSVAAWLKLFDIYLNCSRTEAMSLGILEAMAAERPMVVVDVGDNRLLVGGDDPCGIVVSRRCAADLAAAVERLAGNAALRAQMADNAARRYERHYNTDRMVERHMQLYQELLDNAAAQDARRVPPAFATADNAEATCSH